ncbi:hypothetical protein AAVH_31402 [Aphelenchoides avenae]|nr:hypothetical protein AAVH_31402 [Aphelenchus avenae]
MSFPYIAPVDGGSFCVTVNAIVEFFMQEDVEVAQEGNDPLVYLHLRNGNFTKGLFKHVAEASSVSTRTQPLRIMVSPWRIEDEDLRDFADHLSYRYRGTPGELRVYDFPAEQRGASAAMHLQIVLFPSNMLGIYRARRPSRGFLESDE